VVRAESDGGAGQGVLLVVCLRILVCRFCLLVFVCRVLFLVLCFLLVFNGFNF